MSSARIRTIAYSPRLDLAIRARPDYVASVRKTIPPVVLTERGHTDIVFTKRGRTATDSSSYGWQTSSSNRSGFPNPDPVDTNKL